MDLQKLAQLSKKNPNAAKAFLKKKDNKIEGQKSRKSDRVFTDQQLSLIVRGMVEAEVAKIPKAQDGKAITKAELNRLLADVIPSITDAKKGVIEQHVDAITTRVMRETKGEIEKLPKAIEKALRNNDIRIEDNPKFKELEKRVAKLAENQKWIKNPVTGGYTDADVVRVVNGLGLSATELDGLSDVTITTPSNGEVLKYNGSIWVNDSDAGISNVVEDTTPQLGGDLDVQANSINTSTANGDITLSPNGTGNVVLGTLTFDADQAIGVGQDNYVLTYDNATGLISLEANDGIGISNVVEDTTPQLGGDLDLNGNNITDGDGAATTISKTGAGSLTLSAAGGGLTLSTTSGNSNVTIDPHGTGNVVIGSLTFDGDQTVGAGQDNYVLTYDNGTGLISLEAAAGISNVVEDTTPQLGGQLDVNGNAIGDGTRELITFTEDASAVNHVNIENEATGSGPIISAAGDDTNVDLNLASKGTGLVKLSGGDGFDAGAHAFGSSTETDNGNSGTADTIDWGAGNFQKSTMTGNCTYTFTAPPVKGRYQLMLVQDGTGSRTATWPAAVKWPGGTAPTLSTAASSIDIITFYYDGTSYYGVSSLNFS